MVEEYYHVGDRYHHLPPPAASTPTFQYSLERRGDKGGEGSSPCMICLGLLFAILIIAILIALILFFTIGAPGGAPVPATRAKAASLSAQRQALLTPGHSDFVSPGYVQTATETGRYKICLLDTAYFNDDAPALFRKQHIKVRPLPLPPSFLDHSTVRSQTARHFDIERILDPLTTKRRNLVHPLVFQVPPAPSLAPSLERGALQSYVRGLGVDRDCLVVLYDHGESETALMTATFVWWAFKVRPCPLALHRLTLPGLGSGVRPRAGGHHERRSAALEAVQLQSHQRAHPSVHPHALSLSISEEITWPGTRRGTWRRAGSRAGSSPSPTSSATSPTLRSSTPARRNTSAGRASPHLLPAPVSPNPPKRGPLR